MEKLEGPSTTLTFLGMEIDTSKMEIRLLGENSTAFVKSYPPGWEKRKATNCHILALVGLLQHASKVIQCGCSFVSRMYATAAKKKELDYYTWLN